MRANCLLNHFLLFAGIQVNSLQYQLDWPISLFYLLPGSWYNQGRALVQQEFW